jgi:hypothetical protein
LISNLGEKKEEEGLPQILVHFLASKNTEVL